jgi:hypothetical protein
MCVYEYILGIDDNLNNKFIHLFVHFYYGTDAHRTVTLYLIVPNHPIFRIALLIFPKSEPGQLTYKQFMPLLEKSQRILFEKL